MKKMKLIKLYVNEHMYDGKPNMELSICRLGITELLDEFLDTVTLEQTFHGGNLALPLFVVSRKVFRRICETANHNKSNYSFQEVKHNEYKHLNARCLKMLGYVHEGVVFVPSKEVKDDELFYWNGEYEDSICKKTLVLIVEKGTEVKIVHNSDHLYEARGITADEIIIFQSKVNEDLVKSVLNPSLIDKKGKLHNIK